MQMHFEITNSWVSVCALSVVCNAISVWVNEVSHSIFLWYVNLENDKDVPNNLK